MSRYKMFYIFYFIGITILLFCYYLSTNIAFLIFVLGGADVPSYTYSLTIKRVYENCQYPYVRKTTVDDLISGHHSHLADTYIHILGVIGDSDASEPINEKLMLAVNKMEISTIYRTIDSLGIIGDGEGTDSEILLKQLCDQYESFHVDFALYSLSRAIYLMTGNVYNCTRSNENRDTSLFIVSDELKYARQIIVSSRSRYRTLDEMMFLERLLRPPVEMPKNLR
ncbi:MAG: hypothetical protein ACLQDI_25765 [Syntrophobacteraceae bacterium]